MDWLSIVTYLIIAVVSYLFGSIPFGYILVRLFRGEDVRAKGSGNIGATNVMRSGSKALGITTLLLDAGKGYFAVLWARYWTTHLMLGMMKAKSLNQLNPSTQHYVMEWVYFCCAISAIFAIVGHVFPVWLKFRGGKGVATGVGSFIAIAPKAVLIVLAIFTAVVVVSRYISLGSIVATAAFPVFAWFLYRGNSYPAFFALICAGSLLIIAKHHQNIRRLLAGTEHRFGSKKGASA